MANVIAQKQQSSFPGFADRKLLADTGTRFCIDSAKLHTQKDGKTRWYLGIHFIDIAAYDEVVYQTLTFDQSPSRDDLFLSLQETGDFPQHNCWVEKRTFKNNGTGMMQTFYQLRQPPDEDGECACHLTDSHVLEVEEPVADPFVPDFSDEV